jgi:predicted RNA-binding protein Jag
MIIVFAVSVIVLVLININIQKIARAKADAKALKDREDAVLTNWAKIHLEYMLFRNDYVDNDVIADGSMMQIHLIEAERRDGVVNVDIYLSRPGLLIGRKGSTLNAITEEMSSSLKEKSIINVKEMLPFRIDHKLAREIDEARLDEKENED